MKLRTRIMHALLYWITDRLPARMIDGPQGERYLERYYIGTLFGWRFYLHQFVDDDPDRGLHDHPWTRAFSIVLAGWYIEERRTGKAPVRWCNSLTGDTFHRVILPSSQPVWTLFFHRAGNAKPWGFLEPIEGEDGAALFSPYRYTREGDIREWWLRAPKGREFRRDNATRHAREGE